MKLVLFDFDGTLTKRDTFVEFLKFHHGLVKFYLYALICLPILALWFIKIIDASNAKRKIFNIYIKGRPEKILKENGADFIQFLFRENMFKVEILNDLIKHIEQKNKCVIVSASFDLWIDPFAKFYDINYLSTNLQFENGYYMGEFKTKNCKGHEKVNRILNEIDLSSFSEIIAYGNSKDDLQMMEIANIKHWVK